MTCRKCVCSIVIITALIMLANGKSNSNRFYHCLPHQLKCNDGSCYDELHKCDGIQHCADNSDELKCEEYKQPTHSPSHVDDDQRGHETDDDDNVHDHFSSHNIQPAHSHINYEAPVIHPHPPQFIGIVCNEFYIACDNQRECYLQSNQCDNYPDCSDHSDEKSCDGSDSEVHHVGSDELKFKAACDRRTEFGCNSGKCIPIEYKCNEEYDCETGEDEEHCPCSSEEFTCHNGDCINADFQCDHIEECADGSDEFDCKGYYDKCQSEEFLCDDYTCLIQSDVCDGYVDCSDGTDEVGCKNRTESTEKLPTSKVCRRDEWQCDNGECIENEFLCDGAKDCFDWSDEKSCEEVHKCEEDEFMCVDECFKNYKKCDGYLDCRDHSDEHGCSQKICSELQCENEELCYGFHERCDGHRNCHDGSDEENCGPKTEYAEVGSNVFLRCHKGHLLTRYLWSKPTGLLQSGQNELKLKNVQVKDAGSYVCTSIHSEESFNLTTILVVTGTIPHFPQAPKSYMVLPKLEEAYLRFNFEITFNPERPNGLILYNGQSFSDGISLSLNERFVEFRFDFGLQPTILRAENSITLHE